MERTQNNFVHSIKSFHCGSAKKKKKKMKTIMKRIEEQMNGEEENLL